MWYFSHDPYSSALLAQLPNFFTHYYYSSWFLPSSPLKYVNCTFKDVNRPTNLQADTVSNLSKRPSDDELLQLYGLYKQATVGDNDTAKPGVFDLKGKYKWQAWEDLKGTTQEEAEQKYIALATELIEKYN